MPQWDIISLSVTVARIGREGNAVNYQGLGRRVRSARKAAGMTQCELAERLAISTSFLGHIERGSRKASLETMIRIANELNASLDELLADSLKGAPVSKSTYTTRQRVALRDAVRVLADNIDAFMDDDPPKG